MNENTLSFFFFFCLFPVFPAGILQKEVLSPESPLYLNFPASGFLIGYIFAQNFEVKKLLL